MATSEKIDVMYIFKIFLNKLCCLTKQTIFKCTVTLQRPSNRCNGNWVVISYNSIHTVCGNAIKGTATCHGTIKHMKWFFSNVFT